MIFEINKYIWRLAINSTQRIVLLAIAHFADETWSSIPKIGTLIDMTQRDEKTVKKSIKTLEKLGLLKVSPRYDHIGNGRQISNIYTILNNNSIENNTLENEAVSMPITSLPPVANTPYPPVSMPPPTNLVFKEYLKEQQQPDVVVGVENHADLIIPKILFEFPLKSVEDCLKGVNCETRQIILDEIEGNSRRKAIKTPIRYLHVLIHAVKNGTFVPTTAHSIQNERFNASKIESQRSVYKEKSAAVTQANCSELILNILTRVDESTLYEIKELAVAQLPAFEQNLQAANKIKECILSREMPHQSRVWAVTKAMHLLNLLPELQVLAPIES
jgi:hypothetical protein